MAFVYKRIQCGLLTNLSLEQIHECALCTQLKYDLAKFINTEVRQALTAHKEKRG